MAVHRRSGGGGGGGVGRVEVSNQYGRYIKELTKRMEISIISHEARLKMASGAAILFHWLRRWSFVGFDPSAGIFFGDMEAAAND